MRKKPLIPISERPKYSVKRGDTVVVIAGKDKGKTGSVKQILTQRAKVVVEGINLVKKALRPNPAIGQRGGHVEQEAPIHISNVMLYSTKNSAAVSRPRRETVKATDGKGERAVRVDRKTGEQLDT